MKRFILRSVVFMICTVVCYAILIMIFGLIAPQSFRNNLKIFASVGFTRKRIDEINKMKNVDVLVIGSSRAYRGYDPRLFEQRGLKIFAFGTSAQSPLQTAYLFNKYNQNFNPKFVIVDVNSYLLTVNGLESSMDLVSSGMVDWGMFKIALKINDINLYNTFIYSFFNEKLHIKKQGGSERETDTYIPGGYVQSYVNFKPSKKVVPVKLSLLPVQIKALKEIIATLKARNINFVLIQSPYEKGYYNSFLNNDEIDKWLTTLGPYYNFNKMIDVTKDMCFDENHLNQTGVNVFDKKLLDTLKSGPLNKIMK